MPELIHLAKAELGLLIPMLSGLLVPVGRLSVILTDDAQQPS